MRKLPTDLSDPRWCAGAMTPRRHLFPAVEIRDFFTPVRIHTLTLFLPTPGPPTDPNQSSSSLILAAGAYSLSLVNKELAPMSSTLTSGPGAAAGQGAPPKPGCGGLTGYEGKRYSTSDPSARASLSGGRWQRTLLRRRRKPHFGGRAARVGVGCGVQSECRGLDPMDRIHFATRCIFFTEY